MKNIAVAALLVVTLCACASKSEPSQANFTRGLNAYLEKRGDLCLGKFDWPIDVVQQEFDVGSRNALQMPVLEKLGLASSTEVTVELKTEDGSSPSKARRYQLTDAGRKYYVTREFVSRIGGNAVHQGDFCAARLSLDKVVGWELSKGADDHQLATVSYTYKIDPAPWMQNADAQKVFPVVTHMIQSAGIAQLRETFQLTDKGWIAQDLSG